MNMCVHEQKGDPRNRVAEEIREFLDHWFVQYEKGDVENLVRMGTSDYVSLGTGKEEISFTLEDYGNALMKDMDQRTACRVCNRSFHIRGEGNFGWALVLADYCWDFPGSQMELHGRRTFILRKVRGEWLVEHNHFSLPALGQETGDSYPSLRPLLERYFLLGEATRDIILFVRLEDEAIVEANRAALQEFGYSQEELLRMSLGDLLEKGSLLELLLDSESTNSLLETSWRTRGKGSFPGETSLQRVKLGEIPLCLVVVRNISHRKEIEKKYYLAATRDHLTGVLNRQRFEEILETRMEYARRHDSSLVFVLFDVDDFKKINDSYGHPQGDRVLVKLGALGETLFPEESAFFGRWGGDEFTLLLEMSPDEAILRIQAFQKVLEETEIPPLPAGAVTLSLGMVSYSAGESLEDLMRRVDKALYQAKREGRNRLCFLR